DTPAGGPRWSRSWSPPGRRSSGAGASAPGPPGGRRPEPQSVDAGPGAGADAELLRQRGRVAVAHGIACVIRVEPGLDQPLLEVAGPRLAEEEDRDRPEGEQAVGGHHHGGAVRLVLQGAEAPRLGPRGV